MACGMPASAHAGDSGWVSANQIGSIARTARGKGDIPVSIDCRNGSANPAAFKLQVRVVTKPNGEKRNWSMFAADLDYHPGRMPNEWGNWRKVSGKVLKTPGSGKAIRCSLYYHKSAGTVSDGTPPISAKTTGGIRTLR